MTFAQFLVVSLLAFFTQLRRGNAKDKARLTVRKRAISLRLYAAYVVVFFTMSVLNNKALNYNIAMPFHMIFRSGSLVTSLVLGALLLRRRYTLAQVLSVFAVTAGILLATTASVSSFSELAIGDDVSVFAKGVTMLLVALLLSSLLGILQEYTYSLYPKTPRDELVQEHLFYTVCRKEHKPTKEALQSHKQVDGVDYDCSDSTHCRCRSL